MPKNKPRSKSSPRHSGRNRDTKAAPQKPEPSPDFPQKFIAAWFGFARLCGNARCRRSRFCQGDTCFDAFWPHVPEREKERYRKTITARANRLSIADSIAAGEAAALRCDEFKAKGREWWKQMPPAQTFSVDQRVEPAPPAQPPVEPPPKPEWRPRIRTW